jgi:hypothetical protein
MWQEQSVSQSGAPVKLHTMPGLWTRLPATARTFRPLFVRRRTETLSSLRRSHGMLPGGSHAIKTLRYRRYRRAAVPIRRTRPVWNICSGNRYRHGGAPRSGLRPHPTEAMSTRYSRSRSEAAMTEPASGRVGPASPSYFCLVSALTPGVCPAGIWTALKRAWCAPRVRSERTADVEVNRCISNRVKRGESDEPP